jgi:hypothetical protein
MQSLAPEKGDRTSRPRTNKEETTCCHISQERECMLANGTSVQRIQQVVTFWYLHDEPPHQSTPDDILDWVGNMVAIVFLLILDCVHVVNFLVFLMPCCPLSRDPLNPRVFCDDLVTRPHPSPHPWGTQVPHGLAGLQMILSSTSETWQLVVTCWCSQCCGSAVKRKLLHPCLPTNHQVGCPFDCGAANNRLTPCHARISRQTRSVIS